MLTPDGLPAKHLNKVVLQNMWANTVAGERLAQPKKMIFAAMGKPTAPTNKHILRANIAYWQALITAGNQLKKNDATKTKTPDKTKNSKFKEATNPKGASQSKEITIDYSPTPKGDKDPSAIMAKAMTAWYNTKIDSENILFTVGGVGALRTIFSTFNFLNKEKPYRVVTPFPYYSMYGDPHNRHVLHPIDVLNESGYQLTAKALESSILSALELEKKDGIPLQMLLFSNPSNPLGTVIPEDELLKIAAVLKKYPKIKIVMDEAYAEMYWKGDKIPSLITLAPELKERTIILRSATKAFSAAGERMAIAMAFDKTLMKELCTTNIANVVHAPRAAQIAYTKAMEKFTKQEAAELKAHYAPKVKYVAKRLEQMGAQMPDPKYNIDGTFYVLGDFGDLLGQKIPEDAQRALGTDKKIITNGEELAYSLLFKDSIVLSPLSFYGVDSAKYGGVLRITCADNENTLKEMMDRLEVALLAARKAKTIALGQEIAAQIVLAKAGTFRDQIIKEALTIPNADTCLDYKLKNLQRKELLNKLIAYNNPSAQKAIHAPQQPKPATSDHQVSFFKEPKPTSLEEANDNIAWREFVTKNYSGKIRELLLTYTDEQDRMTIHAWAIRGEEPQQLYTGTQKGKGLSLGALHEERIQPGRCR